MLTQQLLGNKLLFTSNNQKNVIKDGQKEEEN